MIDKKKQGKRNRAAGAAFERRVRADLEAKDYFVSKWANNVRDEKVVPARPGRFRMMQTGFPDFFVYHKVLNFWELNMVEVKTNGYLKPEEKEKALYYLKNGYCDHFWVASKTKLHNGRIYIVYKEVTIDDGSK